MTEMSIEYLGELRCRATHDASGTILITDAPLDNHGKGESFSPTDLVATALGTCMLTVMGIAARKLQIDLTGTKVAVRKEMATSPIRRIAALEVTITVPLALDNELKEKLVKAAMTCPVHASLHPDIRVAIEWGWSGV